MSKDKKYAHHRQAVSGAFKHLIYSPKGMIEGLLLEVDHEPLQVVIEADESLVVAFAKLKVGTPLELETNAETNSSKGEAAHPVHRLHKVVSIGGKSYKPDQATILQAEVKGVVARFNYARHGEPNGVVLDSGDFVHLKPHGMAASALEIGDAVDAVGEARAMVFGHRVIEAKRINGKPIDRKHSAH
jgi:hypothetical protein